MVTCPNLKICPAGEEVILTSAIQAQKGQRVAYLSVGDRQLVEIAKALSMEFRILAMDEPTAALNAAEVARLFAIIERLKRRGVAVLYVSHRLREIFQIADRVTGFRDGKRVDTRRLGELAEDDVVTMMLGRALKKEAPIDRAIPASEKLGCIWTVSTKRKLAGNKM
jgi:ABC-type sugar transport system ATPase subunit